MEKQEVNTEIKDSELVRRKRLQIALGATKLFIKKGYYQTGIREISKASGLTIGNLYDYIKKKEDVLFLVFDVFHSLWVSKLEKEGVLEIKNPINQLKTAIQKMLELATDHRDMVLLMYTESKILPKDFLKIILMKESGLVECFEKILKRGIKEGALKVKNPLFLANTIVYLIAMEPLRGWNLRKRYKVKKINSLIQEYILEPLLKV